MKVLKFGGSSIGTIEGILNIKKIILQRDEPTVVVLSALEGVTDQLSEIANLALNNKDQYKTIFIELQERHTSIIEALVPEYSIRETLESVRVLFDELNNIYRGIYLIRELSDRTLDIVVSYGERVAAMIISKILVGSKLYDSREFIKTTIKERKTICDFKSSNTAIRQALANIDQISIVPGFISTDSKTGDITNLGRGGADYTASIIASAIDAEELEIWTDVDGFMTADPSIIPNSYLIEKLSYLEAMELCNFGAKVIYPPTIYPAYKKNIPITVRNTFKPQSKGSYISHIGDNSEKPIIGISSINDTAIITIHGLGMVGIVGINQRIFKTLADSGISVFLVSQASSENTTSIGVRRVDAQLAADVLEQEFETEIAMGKIEKIGFMTNLATLAIVGRNMKGNSSVAGKLFDTLGRNGINVITFAQGAYETNISLVINSESLNKALNVIHEAFFLSEYQVVNLFLVGVGAIGHNLLQQIEKQQQQLLEQNALQIRVVGIANSKRAIFDTNGIDLSDYQALLRDSSFISNPEILSKEIVEMNIFNSIFVDCTASDEISKLYNTMLNNNISVVTANKIAASSDYANYSQLKQAARHRGVKFLFETNVGAGLPIINTINSMINSGDKIVKIEAVLSGTLNFILNTISKEIPLSQAIKMSQEAGYAEPDPRIDLSGIDVTRKLVILAREAGYPIEQSQVEKSLFIPEEYFTGSLDSFWSRINLLDDEFEHLRSCCEANKQRLRFVAKLEQGEASIKLQQVESTSPLYNLEESNNIILITTERYKDHPLIIKGYGAGASVTAAGLFADIISIVNIR
ncbi:MAG: bifunctional aspartate kinase/homoserine dehydrogenase I [Bacteroidales bacterium]